VQVRLQNHGGLTPAAPVHVRLYIVKVAISSAGERRLNKSGGGVSPPWFGNRACQEDSAHVRTAPPDARGTKSGGHNPPVDHGNALAMTMPHMREAADAAPATRIAIAVAATTAV